MKNEVSWIMMITKKFQIKPTKAQEAKMFQTLFLCRKLYNTFLEQRQTHYKEHGKGLSYNDQQNQLPSFKKAHTEYKEIHSQVLQDVLQRIDTAYKNFFEKRAGYPKFKDKFHYSSFTYPQANSKTNFGKAGHIYLSKIGHVKLNAHQNFCPEKVKTINVKFQNGKWFVNLTTELDQIGQTVTFEKCVGIDMGIKSLAVTSEGKVYENPKWLQKSQKKLSRLQRQLSKKTKGSSNRNKAKRRLVNLHEKVSNQRKDYLHKVSLEIVQSYDLICIEELQTSKMMKNHRLAQSIANASWNKFSLYLDYKSKCHGKKLVKVNPKGTSQNCSSCGNIVPKNLSVRTHKCPTCGLEIDRDYNAAINILEQGLKLVA